jgi:CubicO group peptidase (beta-lactamase class C family)
MLIRGLCLQLAFALAVIAQDKASLRVDEILKQWNKPESPGAAVAVIRNGELVFQKGYGTANLEYGIPITPQTVFHVASVSKQFTAMALVLLEADGKLSLEDDIHKYLPELPDYGKPITIRNLLQHTGGIRDQWQTLAIAGWRLDDVITQDQILRILFRQKELNFAPGTEHLYSNGGYTLAAEIVSRAAGNPFPQFCEDRIFKPLGMSRTHFHQDHKRIVKDRAYSYSPAGSGWEASPLNYANVGATSLFTTAPDLARWLDNFRDPKLGGHAAVDLLQEQAVLSNGKKVDYALGVSVGSYRGLKTLSHGGGDAGYRSFVVWFPELRLGIAVAGNASNFDSGGTAYKVAAVFAEDKMGPQTDKTKLARQPITVEQTMLDRYAGLYRMASGMMLEFESKGGNLQAAPPGQPKLLLKTVAPNRFYAEQLDAEIEFTPKTATSMSIKVIQGDSSMDGERMVIEPFNATELPEYAGAYWSDEVESLYTMVVRQGKLIANHIRYGEIALRPLARDQFVGSQWFTQDVRFTRHGSGHVNGVILGVAASEACAS